MRGWDLSRQDDEIGTIGDDNAIRTVFGDSVSAYDSVGGRVSNVSRGQRFDSPAALVCGDFVCGSPVDGAENCVGAAKILLQVCGEWRVKAR